MVQRELAPVVAAAEGGLAVELLNRAVSYSKLLVGWLFWLVVVVGPRPKNRIPKKDP